MKKFFKIKLTSFLTPCRCGCSCWLFRLFVRVVRSFEFLYESRSEATVFQDGTRVDWREMRESRYKREKPDNETKDTPPRESMREATVQRDGSRVRLAREKRDDERKSASCCERESMREATAHECGSRARLNRERESRLRLFENRETQTTRQTGGSGSPPLLGE